MRFPTPILAAVLAMGFAAPAQESRAAPAAASGATSERVLVVELFSSQACPSCPAAEAVMTDMARDDATLLPLDLHVTYFDRAGWKDAYSLPAASQRQRRYVSQLGTAGVYTPQVVVAGRREALGYDAHAVQAAVAQARRDARGDSGVALALGYDPAGLRVQAGAGQGQGTLWLVGYDAPSGRHGGGVNTVRTLQALGDWRGAPVEMTAALPRGEHAALLLQDRGGAILSAAVLR